MGRTIQVYVVSGKRRITETGLAPSVSGHPCAGVEPTVEYKNEQVLPENHRQVIAIAEKVAEEKGMKLEIYDKSSRKGKLKALLKGVSETPTIIIGDQRISENITEKELLSLVKLNQ